MSGRVQCNCRKIEEEKACAKHFMRNAVLMSADVLFIQKNSRVFFLRNERVRGFAWFFRDFAFFAISSFVLYMERVFGLIVPLDLFFVHKFS